MKKNKKPAPTGTYVSVSVTTTHRGAGEDRTVEATIDEPNADAIILMLRAFNSAGLQPTRAAITRAAEAVKALNLQLGGSNV